VKVLLVVHGLPVGGTEVMVCHLARNLRAGGVEVEIACLDVVGELGEELRDDGFAVTLYGRRSGFDLGLARRIAAHVRKSDVDVVHAHQYTCFFYAALASVHRRFPLVFTEHGRFFPDLRSLKRRVFNRLLGGRADAITAVSSGVRDSLVNVEGFRRERIEILRNGIDIERFAAAAAESKPAARRRVGLPEHRFIVGTIGRLDSIKNQALLLAAIERVARDGLDPLLVIAGDGPERASLEERARRLGIADSVRLLGMRSDTPRLLACFDVFALSSLSEGTPMTLLEAMAASVPILSTGVGGVPEILVDGEEALLVDGVPPDFRNVGIAASAEYLERFATRLSRLATDVDLRRRLANSAHIRVRREFSLEAICRRYFEIYETCARKPLERATTSLQD